MPRHSLPFSLLAAALIWALTADALMAQTAIVPREQHAWARFSPGSWKTVRKVSETFDQRGNVSTTTVTETRTKLVAQEKDAVVLEVQSTVEVSGKRISGRPKTIRVPLTGDIVAAHPQPLGEQELTIDENRVRCQVFRTVSQAGDRRTTVKTYYSRDVAPFVIKKEEQTVQGSGKDTETDETTIVTIALNMPHNVLDEMMTASHVKTMHKHPGGRTITLSVQVLDVPGATVSQTSKELDANGQLIRRHTLEVQDFHVSRQQVMGESRVWLRHGQLWAFTPTSCSQIPCSRVGCAFPPQPSPYQPTSMQPVVATHPPTMFYSRRDARRYHRRGRW